MQAAAVYIDIGPSFLLCLCSINKDNTKMVSLREMARIDAERVPPVWLRSLLEASFFEPCPEHQEASSGGGCNFFCTLCTDRPLCYTCVGDSHAGHQLIQVRKSSKHSVVKVNDVEMLLDIYDVQPYLINGQQVVFLNSRSQMGKGKAGKCRCDNCNRTLLRDAYRFCSLECKLECMDWDLDVSFVVDPDQSEHRESTDDDAAKVDDEGALPGRPTKRLRSIGLGPRGGNRAEDYGIGTSTAPATVSPALRHRRPAGSSTSRARDERVTHF